ncbi:MAG TPA: Gfo/Idh/MocA family oxidoreductase [Opitutaceae bacterium]|jgi:1,5-anhydro-D-fructose reductase (1,5-anhydro-D-mannitol-forming)|nr:Gfo/Idh/MocA family oxidoreductase [Opitutaceae bacterium]
MKTPPPLPFTFPATERPDPTVVRWGIIGCGDVTEVKSGPGFRLAEGSRLVAVMRRNGALAADYARRHGVPRWYDRAEALIADPEVDAVYIATPPDSHESYALQVAAAGKPAYVEKPMARSTVECDRMVAAFHARGVPLYVAYYRRGLPRFLQVKRWIDAGAIGQLTGVDYHFASAAHRSQAGWRTDVRSAGAGLFLDLGSHALDLLDFFLGPLDQARGTAANRATPQDAEDCVALQFSARGVLGVASWNFASGVARDLCRITGTDGCIEYSTFDNVPVRLTTAQGTESVEIPHPPHVQQPLIQQVVHDLLGRDRCPSTGVSARRTSQVMDAALTSYYGDRTGAFWDHPATWPGRRAQ